MFQNKLLATLPRTEQERLRPYLQPVALAFDDVLYEPEEPIRHIYWPTSGLVCLLVVMEDGSVAEVGRVGNEGMVGLPVFLGVPASHTRVFVQIPGEALRMSVPIFRREARSDGPLARLLLRYAQALLHHVSQLTACNSRHAIEQRLCRWLLITHDRVQSDQIVVTQEFLGKMLGVHRLSITLAAAALQRAGLIRYSRGKLRILDRPGLEAAACECYRAINRNYERLFA